MSTRLQGGAVGVGDRPSRHKEGTMTRLSYCEIHHTEESVTAATHRVCLECGHVYETERDLHVTWIVEWGYCPEEIFSCPECSHDF